jgi:hypothetical protein
LHTIFLAIAIAAQPGSPTMPAPQILSGHDSLESCERAAQVINSTPTMMNREVIEMGLAAICLVPSILIEPNTPEVPARQPEIVRPA